VKRKVTSSIITLDSYTNKSYIFKGGKFQVLDKLKRSKKDIIISYVANSDLIIEPIDISSSVPSEHIQNIIFDKVYEELRLDTAIDYGIYPIKTAVIGSTVKYQTIIVDKDRVKERLAPIQKKVKVIDYLLPAPLLYKVLYHTRRLDGQDSDIFLYFGEKEAFVTFYYQGEFLYSKSLKCSLEQVYDRVCQIAQEVFISYDDFVNHIIKNGIKGNGSRVGEILTEIFNECFLNLNDILIYTRRVFGVDRINMVYIGFSWGYLEGIDSYIKSYLNLTSFPIASIYSKEDPARTIDVIHALMLMSAIELEKGEYDVINLTPYPRPAPLKERPAGKILALFTGVMALFLSPVIYNYTVGFSIALNNQVLAKEEKRLRVTAERYKRILQKKRDEIKSLDESIKSIKKLYEEKKAELEKVYNKKFNYKLKSEMLAEISRVFEKHQIKSRDITLYENKYLIDLESKSEKQITAFIKEMTKKYGKEIKDIDIKDITFDKENQLYKGILKIEFREGAI
jgi:hypothetical protein